MFLKARGFVNRLRTRSRTRTRRLCFPVYVNVYRCAVNVYALAFPPFTFPFPFTYTTPPFPRVRERVPLRCERVRPRCESVGGRGMRVQCVFCAERSRERGRPRPHRERSRAIQMRGLAPNEYAPGLFHETLLRAGTPALPTRLLPFSPGTQNLREPRPPTDYPFRGRGRPRPQPCASFSPETYALRPPFSPVHVHVPVHVHDTPVFPCT